jgi:hypothetical protein
MSELSPQFHQSFTEKFSELYNLYKEVKNIVFLAEYENKEQKYIISSVNELRNTLDHIMRSFDSPEFMDSSFDKAKGHLYRAGYDAYEIVVLSKLAEIKNLKEEFRIEAISLAYPEYFSIDIPTIKKAQLELASARGNKHIDNGIILSVEEKHFSKFESIATDLIKTVENLNLHIEGIKEVHQIIIEKEKVQKENEDKIYRHKQRTNFIYYVIVPAIILLIGTIINLCFR